MKRVVLLTGSELRHDYFRVRMAREPGIQVLASFCEGREKSLASLARQKGAGAADLELRHLRAREQAERDFFEAFVGCVEDSSHPISIEKGAINRPEQAQAIRELEPDLLVAYGCSIVREPLLSWYAGRFLNVHLGLSPYYRGSGTNFWPFANGEPEYAGLTFMHIDAGVDTGAILHQVRVQIVYGDSFHQIGNRLIAGMPVTYARLIREVDRLEPLPQPRIPDNARVYRNRDFDDDAVRKLYAELDSGLVERYLENERARCERVPILEHPRLTVRRAV